MHLFLFRHGESILNQKKRFSGRGETSLSKHGKFQAQFWFEHFQNIPLDHVCVSPLKRTLQTARIIFPFYKLHVNESIIEIDFGRWEGLTEKEAYEQTPDIFRAWKRDPWSTAPPDGETLEIVEQRLESFFNHMHSLKVDALAVVTHVLPIKLILRHFFSLTREQTLALYIMPGSLTWIESPEKGPHRLRALNWLPDPASMKNMILTHLA